MHKIKPDQKVSEKYFKVEIMINMINYSGNVGKQFPQFDKISVSTARVLASFLMSENMYSLGGVATNVLFSNEFTDTEQFYCQIPTFNVSKCKFVI